MIGLVVLASVGVVAGVVVASIAPGAARARSSSASVRHNLVCLIGAVVVGSTLLALSGWLIPSTVVAGGTFWLIDRMRSPRRPPATDIDRLDALAGWIENVRDVLMAGEQPIGAIQASVPACAPVIRPAVRRLAIGLGRQDPDAVFRRFADEIDDPLGDLVATGLSIAVRRGARTVAVLTSLSEQARGQVDRRRLVEAERAPMRREVRILALIMSALMLALLVFGRADYLDAYDQPAGQVFLSVAIVVYAGLLVRVDHLGAFPRPGRFLGSVSSGEPG